MDPQCIVVALKRPQLGDGRRPTSGMSSPAREPREESDVGVASLRGWLSGALSPTTRVRESASAAHATNGGARGNAQLGTHTRERESERSGVLRETQPTARMAMWRPPISP